MRLGSYNYVDGAYLVGTKGNVFGNYFEYEKLYTGSKMPDNPKDGDVYLYNGVEYKYNYQYNSSEGTGWLYKPEQNGWGLKTIDWNRNSITYLSSICGKEVKNSIDDMVFVEYDGLVIWEQGWREIVCPMQFLKNIKIPDTATSVDLVSGSLDSNYEIYFEGSEERWNEIVSYSSSFITSENTTFHFNCEY